jgi:hypothetical protein
MKRTGVGILALGTVLLMGTWALAAPANLASLEVLVVDHSGNPVEGTLVVVQTERADLLSLTDESGIARFVVKVTGNGPLDLVVSVLGGGRVVVPLARGGKATVILEEELRRTPEWTIDEN